MAKQEFGENSIPLNQQFQLTKNKLVDTTLSRAQKHTEASQFMKTLSRLRDRGINNITAVVDFSKINPQREEIFSLALYRDEALNSHPLLRTPDDIRLQSNYIAQLMYIDSDFDGIHATITVPSPNIVIPTNATEFTRPSAAENMAARFNSHESIYLNPIGNWNSWWVKFQPHHHASHEQDGGPFFTYNIPLDAVVMLKESPGDAKITPSINANNLSIFPPRETS